MTDFDSISPAPADPVEAIYAQWAREMPDISTRGAQVLARIRRITLNVRQRIEAGFADFGIDSGEFDVLATLRRSGAPFTLRPTELYRSLMISSGGLTDRLDRLEKAGLVHRFKSPEDARSLLVELTPEGCARIEAAFRADMALENTLVEALSETEHQDLVRLLRKLSLSLEV